MCPGLFDFFYESLRKNIFFSHTKITVVLTCISTCFLIWKAHTNCNTIAIGVCVSVGPPMSYTNGVPGGGSFLEHAPGRSPSFPPSSTPDFLSSLSQMGENIAANDMVSVEKQLSQQNSNEHMSAMQSLDGSTNNLNNRPLRHPTPGTPSTGNAPQTPSSLSPVRSSSSSSQSLVRTSGTTGGGATSNGMGAVCTTAGDNCSANNNKLSSQPQPVHNTAADSLNNDLNFDPAAIIDGDGPGQEGLDVSYAPY